MAKRGRPPSPHGPSEKVELRIPIPMFDGLCRAAQRRDNIPLRTLVRLVLAQFLSVEKSRLTQTR